MASTRPIKLDAWGISWEEYRELYYFCLGYSKKRRDAEALLTLRISTPTPEVYHKGGKAFGAFLPRGSGRQSDPVAATAARREQLIRDVDMIEQAARIAADDLAPYLLKAVTTKAGVRALYKDPDKAPPVGERQLYDMRRAFFWILREMRVFGETEF